MDYREYSRKYQLSQARKSLRTIKKIRLAIWIEVRLVILAIKVHDNLTRILIRVYKWLYELYIGLHGTTNDNKYLQNANDYLTRIQEAEGKIKE